MACSASRNGSTIFRRVKIPSSDSVEICSDETLCPSTALSSHIPDTADKAETR